MDLDPRTALRPASFAAPFPGLPWIADIYWDQYSSSDEIWAIDEGKMESKMPNQIGPHRAISWKKTGIEVSDFQALRERHHGLLVDRWGMPFL
jgi:hypothetical protein